MGPKLWIFPGDFPLAVRWTKNTLLVGGAITILKNMSSSMGRMTSHIYPYMKWKIIHSCLKHFETTNQISVVDDLRSGSERFPLWDPILEGSESKYIHATVQWTPAVTQPPPPPPQPRLQHHSPHGSMLVGDPQRSQWRARWHLPRWCHGGRKVGTLEMREMASNYHPGNTFGNFFGEGFFW